MCLLGGNAMKLILTVAISTLMISAASAQTRVMTVHAETASTLRCLLDHGKGCRQGFVARAGLRAAPWLWWTPQRDFELGALVSWKYAGTESENAYTTRLLNAATADVYDVKFERKELTFYIVPPGPDGNVRYMLIRNGAPKDELAELWASNPLGRF